MLITAIAPLIGYEKTADIVQEASEKKKCVIDLLHEKNYLSNEVIEKMCDPKNMTRPQ